MVNPAHDARAKQTTCRISAVVCTRNRREHLRRAIAGLLAQTLDRSRYEIVVVDNGSTDGTPSVVSSADGCGVRLRYVYEPRLGLSHARNAAIAAAEGDLVAFLDDDAVPAAAWLETVVETFSRADVRIGCLQGHVEPVWAAPRPKWLVDGLLGYVSVCDWSPEETVLGEHQFVVAANVTFPRRLLLDIGGFSAALGRQGANLLSGEEEEVRRLIENRGFVTYYSPLASVKHLVHATRLTRRWFVRRAYWQGVTAGLIGRPDWRRASRTFGSVLKDVARFVRAVARPGTPGRGFMVLMTQARKCGLVVATLCYRSQRRYVRI